MATWLEKIKETLKFSDEEVEEMKKDLATDNSEEITALKDELEEAKKGNGKEITKLEAKIEELEKAAKPEPTPEPEDIFKGVSPELKNRFEVMEKSLETAKEGREKADKRATENEDKFNKSEDARKLAEFTKKAEETYPNTPGKPEDKGRILKAISENMAVEDVKELTQMLSAGEEGLRKALITVGQEGMVTGGGLEKIQKAAKELFDGGKATSMEKAMVKATDQNPEWAEEYRREQQ